MVGGGRGAWRDRRHVVGRRQRRRAGSLRTAMEALFGITGKGFTVIASDNNAARSIVKMKADDDKQKELNKSLVMAYAGESGT